MGIHGALVASVIVGAVQVQALTEGRASLENLLHTVIAGCPEDC